MSGKRKASALDAALAKFQKVQASAAQIQIDAVSYTHLRAHET